MKKLYWKQKN